MAGAYGIQMAAISSNNSSKGSSSGGGGSHGGGGDWDLYALAGLLVAINIAGGVIACNGEIEKKEHEKIAKTEKKVKILNDIKNENPTASFVKAKVQDGHIERYAERKTDSAKIKSIKEKYLFRLTQFEQAKQKLQKIRQPLNESLMQAATKGDYIGVVKALEKGADVNYQDAETGNTAMMTALLKSPSVNKGMLIAKYCMTEPNFEMDISNYGGHTQSDILQNKTKETGIQIDSIHVDNKRNRGNSEVDKLAKQVENLYQELDNTYGKEMREALGYEYKEVEGTSRFDNNVVEITYNEDNTKDTTNIERVGTKVKHYSYRSGKRRVKRTGTSKERFIISHKFPTQKAKLKLSMNPEIDSR